MRTISTWLAVSLLMIPAFAQQGTTVNFNLVQVNHYNGQDAVDEALPTPGERVVIDLQNPLTRQKFLTDALQGNVNLAPVVVNVEKFRNSSGEGTMIPWESSTVFHAPSGQDSFRVTSSRSGCPGTEVKPSVSVAFATASGWSNPPIRFGPLTENTICPLGKGIQLEVSVRDDQAPTVRLQENEATYSRR